ncbi:unnamed protein product [Fraxinus pennsylvanica]|uniref:C2H2-type domain-containing protein n=1 Tax=Fraxinus pennsylvanica TaxID=56036 RepID=A0AAD1ZF82_9LAMI|nr:unnamed protein product [Fraxinus pennsylvanica]
MLKKARKACADSLPHKDKKEHDTRPHNCELEGCQMSFKTNAELLLHKRNQCPVDGCNKKFNSHKYAVQHHFVHEDDRPLECPWEGCLCHLSGLGKHLCIFKACSFASCCGDAMFYMLVKMDQVREIGDPVWLQTMNRPGL